ncbi:M15 family metallopeptidase [Candidatus Profftia lariciata]|uniref:M15 family metallopeptidase n=1 Tax=Candidatus Profftia lariciata TaxID=1987921 RepID=UPI001D0142A7|nr:M15 family metallopeptidase [Candidatus Profftia lariciata]UDG81663.1 M15 family metallopeptidase [Candidatus Profftia lariciata]
MHKIITGQSTKHLTILYGNYYLQSKTIIAFLTLQYAAKKDGFNIQPISTFRDFARQQMIWNTKFNGQRPILDNTSRPVNILNMQDRELCYSILRWSALPGASRHHWGTDLDVYDPNLVPSHQKLQLELWEYMEGGCQYPLNKWLSANMMRFNFYCPFNKTQKGVAIEPWHISYHPLASLIEYQLTEALIKQAWQGKYIAGSKWLLQNLTEIFFYFIKK